MNVVPSPDQGPLPSAGALHLRPVTYIPAASASALTPSRKDG